VKTNVASRVVAVIGLVLLLVPLAPAGNGPGGAPGPIQGGGPGPLTCRVINSSALSTQVSLTDSYGTRTFKLGNGRLLCSAATTVGPAPGTEYAPPSEPNALHCYTVTSVGGQGATSADAQVIDDDGFRINEAVTVGSIQFFCTPALVSDPTP
jgi:hypothetical protein